MTDALANFADVPSASTEFPSAKPGDIEGLILEPKYCEICGKTFFRPTGSQGAACAPCGAHATSQRRELSLAAAVRMGISFLEFDPETRTGQSRSKPYLPGDLFRMTCLAGNVAFDQVSAQRRWRFLAQKIDPPCRCGNRVPATALTTINHLYDEHIQDAEDWTPEQLVAWIEEHEHVDPASDLIEQPQEVEPLSSMSISADKIIATDNDVATDEESETAAVQACRSLKQDYSTTEKGDGFMKRPFLLFVMLATAQLVCQ